MNFLKPQKKIPDQQKLDQRLSYEFSLAFFGNLNKFLRSVVVSTLDFQSLIPGLNPGSAKSLFTFELSFNFKG